MKYLLIALVVIGVVVAKIPTKGGMTAAFPELASFRGGDGPSEAEMRAAMAQMCGGNGDCEHCFIMGAYKCGHLHDVESCVWTCQNCGQFFATFEHGMGEEPGMISTFCDELKGMIERGEDPTAETGEMDSPDSGMNDANEHRNRCWQAGGQCQEQGPKSGACADLCQSCDMFFGEFESKLGLPPRTIIDHCDKWGFYNQSSYVEAETLKAVVTSPFAAYARGANTRAGRNKLKKCAQMGMQKCGKEQNMDACKWVCQNCEAFFDTMDKMAQKPAGFVADFCGNLQVMNDPCWQEVAKCGEAQSQGEQAAKTACRTFCTKCQASFAEIEAKMNEGGAGMESGVLQMFCDMMGHGANGEASCLYTLKNCMESGGAGDSCGRFCNLNSTPRVCTAQEHADIERKFGLPAGTLAQKCSELPGLW